jgi:hypothetical protein
MGVIYFITPLIFEKSDGQIDQVDSTFTLDPHEFADALKSRWTDVEVNYSSGEHVVLSWQCNVKQANRLYGELQPDMHTIVLEKPGEYDVAEFAVWYRSIIPPQYRLSLWNDSDVVDFEVLPDTSYLQILFFFGDNDYAPAIAPLEDKYFKINRDDFVSKLKEQWPGIMLLPVQERDPYWLYWEISSEIVIPSPYPGIPDSKGEVLQAGMIDRDQATLFLHYFPDREVAKFAVWYRSITPEEHKLIISIKAKNRSLILEKSTTEQDVINALKPMFL